jgi:hypothetical protein
MVIDERKKLLKLLLKEAGKTKTTVLTVTRK